MYREQGRKKERKRTLFLKYGWESQITLFTKPCNAIQNSSVIVKIFLLREKQKKKGREKVSYERGCVLGPKLTQLLFCNPVPHKFHYNLW